MQKNARNRLGDVDEEATTHLSKYGSTHEIRSLTGHQVTIKEEPHDQDVPSADTELQNVLLIENVLKSMYTNQPSNTGDGESIDSNIPLECELENVLRIENALKQMKGLSDLSHFDIALRKLHHNTDMSAMSSSEDEDSQSLFQEGEAFEDGGEVEGAQDGCDRNALEKEENRKQFQDGRQCRSQKIKYERHTNAERDGYNEDFTQSPQTLHDGFKTELLETGSNTEDSADMSKFQNCNNTESIQDEQTTEELQNCWSSDALRDETNTVTLHNGTSTESFQFHGNRNKASLQDGGWITEHAQDGRMTDIERALLSSPLLLDDDFQASFSSLEAWAACQVGPARLDVDPSVDAVDAVDEAVDADEPRRAPREEETIEEEEVTRSAKRLFGKRTKTLFHWLHPSDSKAELKVRVDLAWDQLSQRESEFYYSQVLGPFNHRQVKPMINPRIFELFGLPPSLHPPSGLEPLLPMLPRRQSTRHKPQPDATSDATSAAVDVEKPATAKKAKRAKRGPYKTTPRPKPTPLVDDGGGGEVDAKKRRGGKCGRPKKTKKRRRKGGSEEDSDYHQPSTRKETVLLDISVELQQCDKILDSDSDW